MYLRDLPRWAFVVFSRIFHGRPLALAYLPWTSNVFEALWTVAMFGVALGFIVSMVHAWRLHDRGR